MALESEQEKRFQSISEVWFEGLSQQLDGPNTELFLLCNTISSTPFLPFSLAPYHIPLLDLLALCWCPCVPSFLDFLPSSVSPEGAFRLVK